jgi:hypothetical protein
VDSLLVFSPQASPARSMSTRGARRGNNDTDDDNSEDNESEDDDMELDYVSEHEQTS